MHNTLKLVLSISIALLLSACGTTDSALKEQLHNDAYVVGFHDGRHSGMKEAGDEWEHFIRDHERFDSEPEYKEDWLAGESEDRRIQTQAQAIGDSVGGAYTGYQINKEVDASKPHPKKIANEAMKGVDTTEMNNLGK
ncbi:MAG: hypothetical protein V7696_11750 [Halioglobus sp.]